MMLPIQVLLFMLPIILAGVTNMIFVKLPVVRRNRKPMDGGGYWRDGKRIFGDNKTWQGFFGMIVFTAFWFGLMGWLTGQWTWLKENSLLPWETYNTPFTEWGYGLLWGFAYVLFELPNSFIKRRLNIPPGRNIKGWTGISFTLIDQADSVIGCVLATYIFYHPTGLEVLLFLLIGTGIHYVVNLLLFVLGLKKQAG
ncbi:CDP-archaeol synthase [Paenibacillus oenotherae]|uniref:CDP-archaeol synthase n=1 Tax=Paenibacillus oenotherae TaxID=1435645 RepID=A0ABS7DDF9_9BACL|nr:CDP-archaeol synthase [Paenibacillus oenotherae]MBW7477203.1 CDP-archaeol synthase [Paenibacillus oenotherae]